MPIWSVHTWVLWFPSWFYKILANWHQTPQLCTLISKLDCRHRDIGISVGGKYVIGRFSPRAILLLSWELLAFVRQSVRKPVRWKFLLMSYFVIGWISCKNSKLQSQLLSGRLSDEKLEVLGFRKLRRIEKLFMNDWVCQDFCLLTRTSCIG